MTFHCPNLFHFAFTGLQSLKWYFQYVLEMLRSPFDTILIKEITRRTYFPKILSKLYTSKFLTNLVMVKLLKNTLC